VNCRAWLVAALVLFLPAAYAAESGYTLKPAELKDQPFLDAVTVVTLAEKTQVEIVEIFPAASGPLIDQIIMVLWESPWYPPDMG